MRWLGLDLVRVAMVWPREMRRRRGVSFAFGPEVTEFV